MRQTPEEVTHDLPRSILKKKPKKIPQCSHWNSCAHLLSSCALTPPHLCLHLRVKQPRCASPLKAVDLDPAVQPRSEPIGIQSNTSVSQTRQESASALHVSVIAQQLILKILLSTGLGSIICVLWILFLLSLRLSHSLDRSIALTQSVSLHPSFFHFSFRGGE